MLRIPSMVIPLKHESVQTALQILVTLLALVLLCAVLANATWVWFAPQVEAPAPPAAQSSAVLVAAHGLFGASQQVQMSASLPTGIALTLLGIVAAAGDEAGYAVVMLGAGEILAVREGAEFAPGVRLVDVEAERLILERDGVRETLTWPPR